MRSVACKIDKSANIRFLIMSPDTYFSTIGFRSIFPQPFKIVEWCLTGL